MKTRIRALLLALVLVLSMTTAAFAADAGSGSACLTVSTVLRDSKIEATVYLQAAEGLTNGRISVAYDPKGCHPGGRPGTPVLRRGQRQQRDRGRGISGLGGQPT